MKTFISSLICIFFLLLHGDTQPVVGFQQVATSLNNPVDVVEENTPAKRLFVVEQSGQIRIINGSSVLAKPFLDISSLLVEGGEQGLLSLAFHPNYDANGHFFVWYNAQQTGAVTLARYTRSGFSADTADPASGIVILQIPKRFTNHNGAKLNFGPDGYLYVATGDGGSGGDPDNNGQDSTTLLGKMLRIDVNNPAPPYYSIPLTNPFAGSTTARPEIIALGLRNPWRWSFDRETGDIWLADVGQNAWEEVNWVPAAQILNRNYGWKCLEGTHSYSAGCTTPANNVAPVFEYPHNSITGGYSVTGGYVYRGTEYPSLQGYYLFADYVSRNGWLSKADGVGGFTTIMQSNWPATISGFGETSDGTLYALSRSGTLYKITASDPLPVKLTSFSAARSGLIHQLSWSVENEEAGDMYILEKRTDATTAFAEAERTIVSKQSVANTYNIQLPVTSNKTWYRLQIKSISGKTHFSQVESITNNTSAPLKAVVISNTIQVSLPQKAKTISLFDANGKLLLTKPVTNSIAERISLQNMAKGIITIRVQTVDGVETVRVVY